MQHGKLEIWKKVTWKKCNMKIMQLDQSKTQKESNTKKVQHEKSTTWEKSNMKKVTKIQYVKKSRQEQYTRVHRSIMNRPFTDRYTLVIDFCRPRVIYGLFLNCNFCLEIFFKGTNKSKIELSLVRKLTEDWSTFRLFDSMKFSQSTER